jgi:hypothetical protein
MADVGFDYEAFQRNNGYQPRPASPDDGLIVVFEVKAIKNESKTLAAGTPKFDAIEFVTISPIGDRTQSTFRKVTDADRARFARQYAAFKAMGTQAVDGFPLEQWPLMAVEDVAEMKAGGISTVEQLSAIADSNLPRFGLNARNWRQKAKDFLDTARGAAPVHALRRENDDLRKDIAIMRDSLDAMRKQYDALVAMQTNQFGLAADVRSTVRPFPPSVPVEIPMPEEVLSTPAEVGVVEPQVKKRGRKSKETV